MKYSHLLKQVHYAQELDLAGDHVRADCVLKDVLLKMASNPNVTIEKKGNVFYAIINSKYKYTDPEFQQALDDIRAAKFKPNKVNGTWEWTTQDPNKARIFDPRIPTGEVPLETYRIEPYGGRYYITGGDTYEVYEYLKFLGGFKFEKPRGWYTTDPKKAQLVEDPDFHKKAIEWKAKKTQDYQKSYATDTDRELVGPRNESLAYYPYQRAGIDFALGRQNTIFGDEQGLGKYQPNDSNVLSPTGWTKIGNIEVGDAVLGSDGLPKKVLGVFPQGVKPVYRVHFSDGSSVEAGLEHLWTMRYWKGGKVLADLVLTTQQLIERPIIVSPSGKSLDLSKLDLYLPMLSAPAQFQDSELPVPSYVLGALLANGYLTGTSADITCNVSDAEEIKAHVEMCGLEHGKGQTYDNAFRFSVHDVIGKIRDLHLNVSSDDKFIPNEYKFASADNRIALLQGLMDGDGSISETRNRVVYHSTNKTLVKDVQELVESLGGTAKIREYNRIKEDKPIEYQISIRLPHDISPFRIKRKANRYHPASHTKPIRKLVQVEYVRDTECTCISVDSSDRLYLTEHCILTHNTIQAIGFINNKPDVKKILIVCPKNMKIQWKRELESWLNNEKLTIGFADNNTFPSTDIVIMNYSSLWKQKPTLDSIAWDAVIIDESQKIANPESQRSKAVIGTYDSKTRQFSIPPLNAKHKLVLSGTALTKKPLDIYPVLHWFDPERIPNKYWIANRFMNKVTTPWGTTYEGTKDLDKLGELLREVMVRRMKKDVVDLPEKTRQVIEMEPSSETKKLLKVMEEKTKVETEQIKQIKDKITELQKDPTIAKDNAQYLSLLAQLHQMERVRFEEIAEERSKLGQAKAPYVAEHVLDLLESTDEKFIVFAHHKAVLNTIRAAIEEQPEFKGSTVLHTGELNEEQRQVCIDSFQNNPQVRVFLATLGSCKEGVTLTAASNVIFAELDYIPATLMQAEDRAHRIGQRNPVNVQIMTFTDSLDAHMAQHIIWKTKMMEAVNAVNPDIKPQKQEDVDKIDPAYTVPEYQTPKDPRFDYASVGLTDDNVKAIEEGILFLAARNPDYATSLNGIGFNRMDTEKGMSLANWLGRNDRFTAKQAVLAKYILFKYRKRQLPQAISSRIWAPEEFSDVSQKHTASQAHMRNRSRI